MQSRTPQLLAIDHATDELILTGEDTPDCDFYHDPKMYKGDIRDTSIQDFDLFLSPENNQCPKCKNYTMSFEVIGGWD